MKYSIRLQRQNNGRKKRPFFLIVVQYSLKGVQSTPLARIGSYEIFWGLNLKKRYKLVRINKIILEYWLSKGAKPNNSIQKLLFI